MGNLSTHTCERFESNHRDFEIKLGNLQMDGSCFIQVKTTGLTGHIEFKEGSRKNFTIDVMETSVSNGVKKVGGRCTYLWIQIRNVHQE